MNQTQPIANAEVEGFGLNTEPQRVALSASLKLLNMIKLQDTQAELKKEYKELLERQEKVRFLSKLQQAINAKADAKGNFDCSKDTDLQKLLQEAREIGVAIPGGEGKLIFNKDEKESLVENLQLMTKDLNVQNEMQFQKVTRLNNEISEFYQLARGTTKPEHDAILSAIRGVRGS